MSGTGESASVAVALAELKGAMETGFATLNGSVNLLAQRNDQTDQQLTALGQRLDDHDARIDAVERGETDRQRLLAGRLAAVETSVAERRWPLASVAAVCSVGALALSAWGTLGK